MPAERIYSSGTARHQKSPAKKLKKVKILRREVNLIIYNTLCPQVSTVNSKAVFRYCELSI